MQSLCRFVPKLVHFSVAMLFCLNPNSRSNKQYSSVQFFKSFFKLQKEVEKKRTEFLCRVCVTSSRNWFISLGTWVLTWVVMLFCLSPNPRLNKQYSSVQFFKSFFKLQKGVEKKRTEFLCRVCVISTQNWFISLDAWVLNWVVMLFWKCAKVQRLFS